VSRDAPGSPRGRSTPRRRRRSRRPVAQNRHRSARSAAGPAAAAGTRGRWPQPPAESRRHRRRRNSSPTAPRPDRRADRPRGIRDRPAVRRSARPRPPPRDPPRLARSPVRSAGQAQPRLLLQHADVLADGRRGVAEARRGALDRPSATTARSTRSRCTSWRQHYSPTEECGHYCRLCLRLSRGIVADMSSKHLATGRRH